jgi:8-oxo-dGTP pyrophosphatase MutT (NUDIX family)
MRDRFPILVHTLLLRGDGILLLRRARTGFLDGWYALPGGHLERGETIRGCALRECAEEAGVRVRPDALEPLAVLAYRADEQQGVNFLFTCRQFEGEPRLAEPDLFDDLRWCRPGEFPAKTVPYIEEAIGMAERGTWFRDADG